MGKDMGDSSGSRERNPQAVSALTGFDPGRVEERDGCRITYFADGLGFVVERIEPIEWSASLDPTKW